EDAGGLAGGDLGDAVEGDDGVGPGAAEGEGARAFAEEDDVVGLAEGDDLGVGGAGAEGDGGAGGRDDLPEVRHHFFSLSERGGRNRSLRSEHGAPTQSVNHWYWWHTAVPHRHEEPERSIRVYGEIRERQGEPVV